MGVPHEKLIVNDRADVAYIMETKGVHLAYHSMDISFVRDAFPTLQIGRSVHSIEEAVEAEAKGAHYLLFGHIYETSSKLGIPPKGLQDLQYMNDNISIPLIAIGGITPENTKEIVQKGVTGIAEIGRASCRERAREREEE